MKRVGFLPENNIIYKKILYSNVIKQVKTGDIILFNHNYKPIISALFGDMNFSHMSIISVEGGVAYTNEIVNDDYVSKHSYPKLKTGIHKAPLHERISDYGGNVYIASLKKKLSDEQLKTFFDYINTPIEYYTNFDIAKELLANIPSKNRTYCTKYVIDLLKKMYPSLNDFSSDITLTRKLKELWTTYNIYNNPIHAVYDDQMTDDLQSINDTYGDKN